MNHRDSWLATWEGNSLHISGTTDLFPDRFSTASLSRVGSEAQVARYRIRFGRDKEHFCDNNLTGAVHHWDNVVPVSAAWVQIEVPDGSDHVRIEIPSRV